MFWFQPIDYGRAGDATYAYMTNSPFGHVFAIELDTLGHLIVNNDAPHRNPENRETHIRPVIFRQLKKMLKANKKQKSQKTKSVNKNGIGFQHNYEIRMFAMQSHELRKSKACMKCP